MAAAQLFRLSHHFCIAITPLQLFHRHQWTASFLSFLSEYTGSVFQQNIRRNASLSTRKLVIKSPSFQFLRHVGQNSLERTLHQICRSIVLDKISCIKTCWWAQAAAIIVSFPPPRTGCGEGRSIGMFSSLSILLLQSSMF